MIDFNLNSIFLFAQKADFRYEGLTSTNKMKKNMLSI